MDKVHFILTGGTIDAEYLGAERDVPYQHSIIPKFLSNSTIYKNIEFQELFMKDSRDITEEDKEHILEAIEYSPLNRTIVTHGTFTMTDTAKFIKRNLKRTDKVVIFTGSMVPLKEKDSDAPRNLSLAFKKLEDLYPGVYIAMNERVFDPDEAIKDNNKKIFYSIHDSK